MRRVRPPAHTRRSSCQTTDLARSVVRAPCHGQHQSSVLAATSLVAFRAAAQADRPEEPAAPPTGTHRGVRAGRRRADAQRAARDDPPCRARAESRPGGETRRGPAPPSPRSIGMRSAGPRGEVRTMGRSSGAPVRAHGGQHCMVGVRQNVPGVGLAGGCAGAPAPRTRQARRTPPARTARTWQPRCGARSPRTTAPTRSCACTSSTSGSPRACWSWRGSIGQDGARQSPGGVPPAGAGVHPPSYGGVARVERQRAIRAGPCSTR